MVRSLDPTRLIDSVTGWNDHGAGDYHVSLFSNFSASLANSIAQDNHHYPDSQCGTPWYSLQSTPYDSKRPDNPRIAIQGEFGGIGNNVSIEHLWNVQKSIDAINGTYEIDSTLEIWNYRAHFLLSELREQIERFSCSGAIWTQTTDVEGEVNGMLTYDRRVNRMDQNQWKKDIQALYDTAAARSNGTIVMPKEDRMHSW